MIITDDCINCGACKDECPTNSIYDAGESYKIGTVTYPPISEDHSFIVPPTCDNCGTCKDACAIGAISE